MLSRAQKEAVALGLTDFAKAAQEEVAKFFDDVPVDGLIALGPELFLSCVTDKRFICPGKTLSLRVDEMCREYDDEITPAWLKTVTASKKMRAVHEDAAVSLMSAAAKRFEVEDRVPASSLHRRCLKAATKQGVWEKAVIPALGVIGDAAQNGKGKGKAGAGAGAAGAGAGAAAGGGGGGGGAAADAAAAAAAAEAAASALGDDLKLDLARESLRTARDYIDEIEEENSGLTEKLKSWKQSYDECSKQLKAQKKESAAELKGVRSHHAATVAGLKQSLESANHRELALQAENFRLQSANTTLRAQVNGLHASKPTLYSAGNVYARAKIIYKGQYWDCTQAGDYGR